MMGNWRLESIRWTVRSLGRIFVFYRAKKGIYVRDTENFIESKVVEGKISYQKCSLRFEIRRTVKPVQAKNRFWAGWKAFFWVVELWRAEKGISEGDTKNFQEIKVVEDKILYAAYGLRFSIRRLIKSLEGAKVKEWFFWGL